MKAYRLYVADALLLISENTARAVRDGRYLRERYVDMIKPKQEDPRTAEEIINSIKQKLGGERV